METNKKERTKAEELALAAAKEAVKELKTEELKAKNKRILQNINLLLEHYYELKAFCEHVECQGETLIMLNHLDAALELLKARCEKTNTPDKYTVIDMLHLDPSLQDMDWVERLGTVCLELDKSESTIRRWHSEMVQQLGIYLFGLDGLKLMN